MTTDASTTNRHAPDPEAPGKPDSPDDLDKRSWIYVLQKTIREFSSDQCTDIAASLAYYAVLSIFPGLIAIFSLLGVFGQGQAASDALLDIVDQVAPGDTAETIRGPIEQMAGSPAAGYALVTGILLAIWSASGYVGAFSRAMNRIYEIEEGRPFWKLKPTQLLITVIAIVLFVLAATILVVSGPVTEAVGNALGLGDVAQTIWSILKWPVLAFIVVLIVAILYYATPNAKQPKFRWISIGALLAIVILALATLAFGFYVVNFSNYDRTYGSLAGIIIFLLWLWIANLALLFGAEFDAELERGRQLQAGIETTRKTFSCPRATLARATKPPKRRRRTWRRDGGSGKMRTTRTRRMRRMRRTRIAVRNRGRSSATRQRPQTPLRAGSIAERWSRDRTGIRGPLLGEIAVQAVEQVLQ